MAKVVILCGNKRAGKTTLSLLLHSKYNFNYYNFDSILDAIEVSFPKLSDGDDYKYIKLLEEMVEGALNLRDNFGISTVFDYVFTPEQLNTFKFRDDVEIYFLANLDANIENVISDILDYSKEGDWTLTASEEDLVRNRKHILDTNEMLVQDTLKYNFTLINTSRGEKRNSVLEELASNIAIDNVYIK